MSSSLGFSLAKKDDFNTDYKSEDEKPKVSYITVSKAKIREINPQILQTNRDPKDKETISNENPSVDNNIPGQEINPQQKEAEVIINNREDDINNGEISNTPKEERDDNIGVENKEIDDEEEAEIENENAEEGVEEIEMKENPKANVEYAEKEVAELDLDGINEVNNMDMDQNKTGSINSKPNENSRVDTEVIRNQAAEFVDTILSPKQSSNRVME